MIILKAIEFEQGHSSILFLFAIKRFPFLEVSERFRGCYKLPSGVFKAPEANDFGTL